MPFFGFCNNLPISNLPYSFKNRLIQLASMDDCNNLCLACSNIVPSRYRRYTEHKRLYITDNQTVFDIAVKEKVELINIEFLKRLSDGPLTIDPEWKSVLLVDDIVAKNDYLCLNETLILYFTSNESYNRVIPFICGPYSRLIMYGDFTWTQVKRLLHSKVKQVRIMGKVEVNPEDYDDVVKFVFCFARDLNSKMSFRIKDCFPSELMKRINKACATHATHSLVHHRKFAHFVKKGSQKSYYIHWVITVLVYASLIAVVINYFDSNYENDGSFLHTLIGFTLLGVASFIFPIFGTGWGNLTNKYPRDVIVYLRVKYPGIVLFGDE